MKNMIAALVLIASSAAFAEKLHCNFAEAYFTLDYDSATKVLTHTSSGNDGKPVVVRTSNLRVMPLKTEKVNELTSYLRYALVDSKGKAVLRLTQNFAGSNGVSNTVFPFSAQYPKASHYANGGIGGCESSSFKAVSPEELNEQN